MAVICYNNSIHNVTKLTPFEIVHGYLNVSTPFELSDAIITNEYMQKHIENTQLRISKRLFFFRFGHSHCSVLDLLDTTDKFV